MERKETLHYQRRLEHLTQVDQEIQRKKDLKDEMEKRKIEDEFKAFMKMKAQQEQRAIQEKQEKEAEQRRLKRQWQEDKRSEDAKRLKEQEAERQKDEQKRKIDELKKQLEELENAHTMDHEDQVDQDEEMLQEDEQWEDDDWTKEEWDEYEAQNQEPEETRGSSSKDSSYVVVNTPSPKGSRTGSPTKGKAEDPKSAEEINLTATIKTLTDSQRETLKLIDEEKLKGNGTLTEEEKMDVEDQRIKEVELGKLEELNENAAIACGDWMHRIKPVNCNLSRRARTYWLLVERSSTKGTKTIYK